MDGLVILLTGFISFGAGLGFSAWSFKNMIRSKADTGIRLESGGRLFVITEVELET